ncbi:MAG: UDP-N-acetylmuramate--L-alanine ligase [Proteobacteria bacterium]|nr:UDP-N-acetylmuramate--L-alanine ligase [Pseudomonadota bacterium]
MYKKDQHIHFVGIGGIGMSGIAEVLLNLGYRVSGSDVKSSDITQRLSSLGAALYYGHARENIKDVSVVVISSAIKPGNPELSEAQERNIPVIPRAEMLAELMRLKYGIAVAGAHGKTTTTSLIAAILGHGGIDPTVVIGGRLNTTNTNAQLGSGEFLVAEADESDGSFLKLSPTIAVVTNIDREHMDYYKSMREIKKTFLEFINKVPFYGLAVICLDNENLQSIIPKIGKRFLTYGCAAQTDLQAREIALHGFQSSFSVFYHDRPLGSIELKIPGMHNIYNSLAAIAVGLELNLPFSVIREALAQFRGVQRRFQIRAEKQGIVWVDDYGHHPTEIKTTLRTAKEVWQRRLVVVFQPHRYSRTRDLFKEFMVAFYDADVLIVTDIYAASESPIPDVSGMSFCEGLKEYGCKDVTFIPHLDDVKQHLRGVLKHGDIVLTLGAGDVWKTGYSFMQELPP